MIANPQPEEPTYHAHRSGLGADTAEPSENSPRSAAPHPFTALREQIAVLAQQFGYYFEIRKDQLRLKVRTWLMLGAVGVLAAIVGVIALVVAAYMVLNGIALGIAELLDGQIWAGQLITGFGVLGITAATIYAFIRRATAKSQSLTRQKYERLQYEQRVAAERRAAQRTSAV